MLSSVRKVATSSQIRRPADLGTIDNGMAGTATLPADLDTSGMR
jgi:hypothetical protein